MPDRDRVDTIDSVIRTSAAVNSTRRLAAGDDSQAARSPQVRLAGRRVSAASRPMR
jgi:hypothetical protein